MSTVRVAVRREGDQVVAYLAREGTMEGALRVGSIAVGAAAVGTIFDEFVSLMSNVAKQLLQDVAGLEVKSFEIRSAPEHERAGHA